MADIDKKSNKTLKKQFTTRLLIVLLVILSLSGTIQYMYLNQKIQSDVSVEALKVSKSIEQGIYETQAASKAIELQLDLKLKLIAQRISDRLGNKPLEEITNKELVALSEEFNIAGVTLLEDQGAIGIVGVKSTEPEDIGFNFKEFLGEDSPGYQMTYNLMHGKEIQSPFQTYVDENSIMLPIAPSGSHSNQPTFFKYGYYKPDNKDYVINPYFEANEVHQFTQEVGPNAWIKTVLESNNNVEEIAVLSPQVYADPSLLEIKTMNWKKINYGSFDTKTQEDVDTLVKLADKSERVAYISEQDDKTLYKVFVPTSDDRVIYIGLNYDQLSAPLKNMSIILLVFSLLSLVALFILSTRFFSTIYKNIQKIIEQILKLEQGDFTARSNVNDKGELGKLSESTNKMATTLNNVLSETKDQAIQTERHAYLLESEANNSVEKVYTMSMESTAKIRESSDEIEYFIGKIENNLKSENMNIQEIENYLQQINDLVQKHSNSTTEMTITLSDLLKSLHGQSSSLSEISKKLLIDLEQFNLNDDDQSSEE